MLALPTRPPIPPLRSCPSGGSTLPTSSVTRTHAPSVRTTPSPSRASGCRSTSSRAGVPARGCASSCAAISMASTACGLARAASGTTTPAGAVSRRRPRPARAACSRLCPPPTSPLAHVAIVDPEPATGPPPQALLLQTAPPRPRAGLTPYPDAVRSRVKPERSIHLLTTGDANDLTLLAERAADLGRDDSGVQRSLSRGRVLDRVSERLRC